MPSYWTISTPSGATRAAARRSAAFDDASRRLPLMVTILNARVLAGRGAIIGRMSEG